MRILFLTHRLPYAPNRGDRVRAYHLLRVLSQRADIDLLSLVHDAEEASHVGDLSSVATSVTAVPVRRVRNLIRTAAFLPTSRPTTHTMLDAPDLSDTVASLALRSPDVVLGYCSGMARFAFERSLAAKPFVLDMVDVDSAKWADMAGKAAFPKSWIYTREARVLRAFEADAARRASTTIVVTEKERQTMAAIAPDANVAIVSNGVEAARLRPASPPAGEPVVVFCGVMNYGPNEEATVWFSREVWPRVVARRPEARFEIIGANPTPSVKALVNAAPGITVLGAVPEVAPYLWKAALSVAPLLTARGVQNKVLEAVAAGLPTVVTPVVAEGLPVHLMSACTIAGSSEAFAAAVLAYLDMTPDARRALALAIDFDSLSWDRMLAPVYEILERATAPRS